MIKKLESFLSFEYNKGVKDNEKVDFIGVYNVISIKNISDNEGLVARAFESEIMCLVEEIIRKSSYLTAERKKNILHECTFQNLIFRNLDNIVLSHKNMKAYLDECIKKKGTPHVLVNFCSIDEEGFNSAFANDKADTEYSLEYFDAQSVSITQKDSFDSIERSPFYSFLNMIEMQNMDEETEKAYVEDNNSTCWNASVASVNSFSADYLEFQINEMTNNDSNLLNAMDVAIEHLEKILLKNKSVCIQKHPLNQLLSEKFSLKCFQLKESNYDGAVFLLEDDYSFVGKEISVLQQGLKAGGICALFLLDAEAKEVNISKYGFREDLFKNPPTLLFSHHDVTVYIVQKRKCGINHSVAKWKSHPLSKFESEVEDEIIDDLITFNGKHDISFLKNSLEKYGFVILKDFISFAKDDVENLYKAAILDSQEALKILEEKEIYSRNLTQNKMLNFKEIEITNHYLKLKDGRKTRIYDNLSQKIQFQCPYDFLQEKEAGFHIQLLNSNDNNELFHADEPHLFCEDGVPPHGICIKVKIFLDYQEVFVAGSHIFSKFQYFCKESCKESWKDTCKNIIRPKIDLGDAVLYDTRIMHFTQSSSAVKMIPSYYLKFTPTWIKAPNSLNSIFEDLDCPYLEATKAIMKYLGNSIKSCSYLDSNIIHDLVKVCLQNHITTKSNPPYEENAFDVAFYCLCIQDPKKVPLYLKNCIAPNGYFIVFFIGNLVSEFSKIDYGFSDNVWNKSFIIYSHPDATVIALRKTQCSINLMACPYKLSSQPNLLYEKDVLSKVTVICNVKNKLDSSALENKAVDALLRYGFCILRNFFCRNTITSFGNATLLGETEKLNYLSVFTHNLTLRNILQAAFNPSNDICEQQDFFYAGDISSHIIHSNKNDQMYTKVSHIFSSTGCLPPHCIQLFLPAAQNSLVLQDGSTSLGGMAFVAGSHAPSTFKRIMMPNDKAKQELHKRIIRPTLVAGDSILFDCRMLVINLKNSSSVANPFISIDWMLNWFRHNTSKPTFYDNIN